MRSMRALDLSQDFGMHTPGFAGYAGPAIRWIKRLAFDTVGGQEITTTLHVGTHLDAPAHFFSGGKFIGDLPLDWLVGPACVVDLERMGVGDYELYGPEHFERWEKDTGISIERGDILIVHTGFTGIIRITAWTAARSTRPATSSATRARRAGSPSG